MKHRLEQLKHVFVEHMPEQLQEGVLYVSVAFATAAHKCCCGCGNEVFTPVSPTDWTLSFDGKSVSLDPSIGNWGFHCRSHYWIRRNRILWAEDWPDERIEATRAHDRHSKAAYYEDSAEPEPPRGPSLTQPAATSEEPGFWRRVKTWLNLK